MVFRLFGQGVEPGRRGADLLGGEQAQLAFGQPPRLIAGQGAQQRRQTFAVERAAQDVGVTGAARVVGDNSDQPDAHAGGIQLKPGDQRGGGPGHAPSVEHERHGDAEGAGAVGGAARRVAGGAAVEKPHDAFAHGGVGVVGAAVPQRADAVAAHHPGIEIAGRAAGGLGVKGRVDVVRPALEPLHAQPAPRERPHQRDPRRRLPLPGTGGGQAKSVKCRVHGGHTVFIPYISRHSRALRTARRNQDGSGGRL